VSPARWWPRRARPYHIPLSIGDGELTETADSVVSVTEMLNYWIGPGRIDRAFLGAAQLVRTPTSARR
jgi:glutaconate CoA-transferase subunit B